MDYLAGGAGATLGYITNGARGAVRGYYAGRNLQRLKSGKYSAKKWISDELASRHFPYRAARYMAPVTRSRQLTTPRSRSRGRTSTRTPTKRQRVISSTTSGSRSLSIVSNRPSGSGILRTGRTNESASGLRAAKVKNRVNKRVTIRKPKKLKVSKNFKLKVEKALKPKGCSGYYLENDTNEHTFPIANGNKQWLSRLGNPGTNHVLMFNPSMVLDAASVLFNGKVASQTKETIAAGVYNFGTGSFDARTVKIPVHNAYSAYVLRNNSNRTWIISLYECCPKQNMDIVDEGDCITQWINAMLNETNNASANPALFPINCAGATPETLYTTPQRNKMLMLKWNIERHDIILDPGQSYDHFVQGPSNVVYDYAKFWKTDSAGVADKFYDLQKKFTRQLFMVARLDLTQDAAAVAARYGAGAALGSLLCEWKNYVYIGAPEQTGGTVNVPALGTVAFNNNQNRDPYFHKTWHTYGNVPTIRTELQTGTDNQ